MWNPFRNSTPPSSGSSLTAVNDSLFSSKNTDWITGNVLDNDSDSNSLPLTVTQFTVDGTVYLADASAYVAGVGTVEVFATGEYYFLPDPEYIGPVPPVTYTVTNGTNTAVASITIGPVIEIPPAATLNIDWNTPQVPLTSGPFPLLSSAAIAAGLEVTKIGSTKVRPFVERSVTISPGFHLVHWLGDGTVNITPSSEYAGTFALNYETLLATDIHNVFTASIAVTVAAVNRTPEAVDDIFTLSQNKVSEVIDLTNPAFEYLIQADTDPDGDALTVTHIASTAVAQGTPEDIAVTNGTVNWLGVGNTITLTPAVDYVGDVIFQYTLSDSHGATDQASVTATVVAVPALRTAEFDDIGTAVEGDQVLAYVVHQDTVEDASALSNPLPTGWTASHSVDYGYAHHVIQVLYSSYDLTDEPLSEVTTGNQGFTLGVGIEANAVSTPSSYNVSAHESSTLTLPEMYLAPGKIAMKHNARMVMFVASESGPIVSPPPGFTQVFYGTVGTYHVYVLTRTGRALTLPEMVITRTGPGTGIFNCKALTYEKP